MCLFYFHGICFVRFQPRVGFSHIVSAQAAARNLARGRRALSPRNTGKEPAVSSTSTTSTSAVTSSSLSASSVKGRGRANVVGPSVSVNARKEMFEQKSDHIALSVSDAFSHKPGA